MQQFCEKQLCFRMLCTGFNNSAQVVAYHKISELRNSASFLNVSISYFRTTMNVFRVVRQKTLRENAVQSQQHRGVGTILPNFVLQFLITVRNIRISTLHLCFFD